MCEGSRERERGIDIAHRNREHSGQREGAQRSLSGSLVLRKSKHGQREKHRFEQICDRLQSLCR